MWAFWSVLLTLISFVILTAHHVVSWVLGQEKCPYFLRFAYFISAILLPTICSDPSLLLVIFVQTLPLMRVRRRNCPICWLNSGRLLPEWAPKRLELLQIQLRLPPMQLKQLPSMIGKRGWWPLIRMMGRRARALSSKSRGWGKPWHLLSPHLVGLQLSGITPRAPPPHFNLLFMRVR